MHVKKTIALSTQLCELISEVTLLCVSRGVGTNTSTNTNTDANIDTICTNLIQYRVGWRGGYVC